jgi:hypothetical protein
MPRMTVLPTATTGPDWFVGGVFIGAGRWFHGPRQAFTIVRLRSFVPVICTEGVDGLKDAQSDFKRIN